MLLEKLSGFSLLDLIVLTLATYRLSIMLSNTWETGALGVLTKLREWAGVVFTREGDPVAAPGTFADGVLCNYCNSVWIGFVFMPIYMLLSMAGLPAVLMFLPLALSGATVLIVDLMAKYGRS